MNDKPSLQKLHTTFDFDFKIDISSTSQIQADPQIEGQPETVVTETEPRSPRTPTYTSTISPTSSNTTSPFDASKYYSFPSSTSSPNSASSLSVSTSTNSPTIVITPPTPTDTANTTKKSNNNIRLSIPTPPTTPLPWIWTCHLCHTRYPLGTTRRCLIDGHYYCSGVQDSSSFQSTTNANKRQKRRKRGAVVACASEFDYVGWEEYMRWRRVVMEILRHSMNVNTSFSGDGEGDGDSHEKANKDKKRETQRTRIGSEIEKESMSTSKSTKLEKTTTTTTTILTLHNSNKTQFKFNLQGCEKCEYPSECRYEKMSLDSFSAYCDSNGSSSINYYENNSNGGSKMEKKVK